MQLVLRSVRPQPGDVGQGANLRHARVLRTADKRVFRHVMQKLQTQALKLRSLRRSRRAGELRQQEP